MATKTETATTVTLPGPTLYRMLSDAMLFAHRDSILPALNVVRLEATGQRLIAVATDRFTFGMSSTKLESSPFQVSIPLEQAKFITTLLRPVGRRRIYTGDVHLRVTPKATRVTVVVGDTSVELATERTDFPQWRHLLKGFKPGDLGVIGFNPTYMARFAKVGVGSHASFIFSSPSKATMVRIGDDFVGLIMPVRLVDTPSSVPDWAL